MAKKPDRIMNKLSSHEIVKFHYIMGNENRLAIIDLCYIEENSITHLASMLRISYPVLLQHLSILDKEGLINKRSLGQGKPTMISTNQKKIIKYYEGLIKYYKEFSKKQRDPMFK